MFLSEPQARVRLSVEATSLEGEGSSHHSGDFKKMLLLERSPAAGKPLLGTLMGFRKLVVGNRDYRIVWWDIVDHSHQPILEIAEVWAVGARADSEIYEDMGRLFAGLETPDSTLPPRLVQALENELHLSSGVINTLSQDHAQQWRIEHWAIRRN